MSCASALPSVPCIEPVVAIPLLPCAPLLPRCSHPVPFLFLLWASQEPAADAVLAAARVVGEELHASMDSPGAALESGARMLQWVAGGGAPQPRHAAPEAVTAGSAPEAAAPATGSPVEAEEGVAGAAALAREAGLGKEERRALSEWKRWLQAQRQELKQRAKEDPEFGRKWAQDLEVSAVCPFFPHSWPRFSSGCQCSPLLQSAAELLCTSAAPVGYARKGQFSCMQALHTAHVGAACKLVHSATCPVGHQCLRNGCEAVVVCAGVGRQSAVLAARDRAVAQSWFDPVARRREMSPEGLLEAVGAHLVSRCQFREDMRAAMVHLWGEPQPFFVRLGLWEALGPRAGGVEGLRARLEADGVPISAELLPVPWSEWRPWDAVRMPFVAAVELGQRVSRLGVVRSVLPWYLRTTREVVEEAFTRIVFPRMPPSVKSFLKLDYSQGYAAGDDVAQERQEWVMGVERRLAQRDREDEEGWPWWVKLSARALVVGYPLQFLAPPVLSVVSGLLLPPPLPESEVQYKDRLGQRIVREQQGLFRFLPPGVGGGGKEKDDDLHLESVREAFKRIKVCLPHWPCLCQSPPFPLLVSGPALAVHPWRSEPDWCCCP